MKNLEHNQLTPDEYLKKKPKRKRDWILIKLLIKLGRWIFQAIELLEGNDSGD